LQEGSIYKGFALSQSEFQKFDRQFAQYPYVIDSYFKGASPENGYTYDFPTQMDFSSNAYSGDKNEGNFKVFVECYGSDSPRPIRLIRNGKGYWKAVERSIIITVIRPPVEDVDDDL